MPFHGFSSRGGASKCERLLRLVRLDLEPSSPCRRETGVRRGQRVIREMIRVNLFHAVCWMHEGGWSVRTQKHEERGFTAGGDVRITTESNDLGELVRVGHR